MTALILALALLATPIPTPPTAPLATGLYWPRMVTNLVRHDLGVLRIAEGFSGDAPIDFGQDVRSLSMVLTAYSVPPRAGVGGTVLWRRTLSPMLGRATQQAVRFAAGDAATPTPSGGLYAELDIQYPDGSHAPRLLTVVIEGR